MCGIRCRTADSDVSECQCSCEGKNHGKQMSLWDFDEDEISIGPCEVCDELVIGEATPGDSRLVCYDCLEVPRCDKVPEEQAS